MWQASTKLRFIRARSLNFRPVLVPTRLFLTCRGHPLSLSLLDRVCPSHSRPFFVLNDESFSFFSLHLINKPWKRLLSSHCYGRKSELRLTSELLFVFLFSIVAETRSRLHLEKKFNFRNSYRSFANNASVDFCNFWIVKSFVE